MKIYYEIIVVKKIDFIIKEDVKDIRLWDIFDIFFCLIKAKRQQRILCCLFQIIYASDVMALPVYN